MTRRGFFSLASTWGTISSALVKLILHSYNTTLHSYNYMIKSTTRSRGTSTKPRPRNAVATRDAILLSALRAFADRGFNGVGLREIAQGAGVTAMLVRHYFGSKEQLFSEVVARAVATPIILNQENIASGKRAEALATALVKMTNADD